MRRQRREGHELLPSKEPSLVPKGTFSLTPLSVDANDGVVDDSVKRLDPCHYTNCTLLRSREAESVTPEWRVLSCKNPVS